MKTKVLFSRISWIQNFQDKYSDQFRIDPPEGLYSEDGKNVSYYDVLTGLVVTKVWPEHRT